MPETYGAQSPHNQEVDNYTLDITCTQCVISPTVDLLIQQD